MSDAATISLTEISIDDRFQPRCGGLSEEHLTSLMETPETWPPIVLARINERLLLIDGFHRVEAATRLECDSIVATIFAPTEATDLLDIAFRLNLKHGRPLTLQDRKAYAIALIAANPDASSRDIGRRTSLHHETIEALRNASSNTRPQRKSGTLPTDVDLFDPIRFRRKATRDQKAIAGYIARLRVAMDDPYFDHSTVEVWPDDPSAIAQACVLAMGHKRANETFTNLELDARFILQVAKAAQPLLKEAT
jgi:hypothetical protein